METHAQYDGLGNVRNTRDANGNLSQVSYLDSFCNNGGGCGTAGYVPNTFAFPTASKSPKPDPSGTYGSMYELTTSTVYDFYTGLAYSSTDANNQTTQFEYESQPGKLDRLKAVVRPDGGRTDIEYSLPDEPLYVRTLTDLDGARRLKSEQHFDKLGRPSRSFTWENQNANNPWLTSDTLYDALGRAWRVSNPYRSTGPGSEVDEGRAGAETTFDALGRVRQVKSTADGGVVRTDYSGDRVLVTDQTGRQRISKMDALGRLREVWEVTPNDPTLYQGIESVSFPVISGAPAPAAGYRTEYFYDAAGNLRRVKQGTQQRFFAYDALGRLVRAKNAEQDFFTAGGDFPALKDPISDNEQWSAGYVYDANGNLVKRKDARGTTAAYGYDALNRNTTVTYTPGNQTASTPNVRRYYDNPAAAANGLGRPWKSEAEQTSLTTVGQYDEAGRPEVQTQQFWVNTPAGPAWGEAYTTTLGYNKAGEVTTQFYPSGNRVEYRYDAMGRLGDDGALPAFKGTLGDSVERTYASQLTYGESGGLRQERFGTDTPLYHKLHYNRRGQLFDTRLSTQALQANEWDWDRGAVVNYYGSNYAWEGDPNTPASADNNGNLRRQQILVPGDGQNSPPTLTQQTYGYDALNRLSWVVEAAGANGVVGADSFRQAYDYDRWGNRTVNAEGTWLGPLPPAPAPTPTPSELVNEKQFDKSDFQNTNRLYAPGDTALLMGQRLMQYDGAGNLINDDYTGGGTRAYDAENRMTSAQTGPSQTASYAYDADGRRVKRLVGGAGEVWQVYGLGGELVAEYAKEAPANQPRKEYGYRGGELLVVPTAPSTTPPPARSVLTATPVRTGTSVSVSLSWAATGAAKYRVERSEEKNWVSPQLVGTTQASSLGDGGALPGRAYLYRVCSADAGGNCTSPYGNAALGAAYAFTDDPLVTPSDHQNGLNLGLPLTPIRAVHVTELRAAIDAVRVLAGLGGAQWAVRDEDLPGAAVHRSHVQELRERLGEALQALWVAAPGYFDPDIGSAQSGTVTIKRKHFTELREAATSGRGGAGSGGSGSVATGIKWLVADQLGTPRMVVDKTGSLAGVTRHDYLPFGEELLAGVGGRETTQGYSVADNVQQKFTGKERDNETALDYFGARYYASGLGRFTGVDSAGPDLTAPQTMNMYRYALNNPLRYVDKTGRYEKDVHYWLTRSLAFAAGFSWGDADTVGRMTQLVDDDYRGPWKSKQMRELYHFTTPERQQEVRAFAFSSAFGADDPLHGQSALYDIGTYLHVIQDAYSHAGFGPNMGQLWPPWTGTTPDKTYNDPGKADAMAAGTYAALVTFGLALTSKKYENGIKVAGAVPWETVKPYVERFNRARKDKEKLQILEELNQTVREYRRMAAMMWWKDNEENVRKQVAGCGCNVTVDQIRNFVVN